MNTNNTGKKDATHISNEIEAKMQTMQASLRRERDKAHRDYQLAMERLQLLRAEVESVETAVQDRQKELTMIVQETQRLEEKMTIAETVARLSKEVDFQHAEVVAKREKIKQMTNSIKVEVDTRQNKIRASKNLAAAKREELKKQQALCLQTPTNKDALQKELQDDFIRERFATEWLALVQTKQGLYQAETTRMHEQTLPILQHFVQRYTKKFGTVPTNGTTLEDEEKDQSVTEESN